MAYRTSSFGGGNPFGFTVTPWVKRLMIANAIIFVITLAFPVLLWEFAFVPAEILDRPWALFTYMFTHGGFFHLFFNMLVLFFFGPPLEQRWGGEEFLKFYLITGFSGALLSLLMPNQAIIGASGAIYGVMVAFAMYWPENPVYIWGILPVKAKWLVIFMVGIDLFGALGRTGAGSGVAHLAHLGGALAAFLYIRSGRAASPWGPAKSPRRRKSRWSILSSSSAAAETQPREPAPRRPSHSVADVHRSLDEVDRILDKISSQGLSSLTEEERQLLDDASRRFRTN